MSSAILGPLLGNICEVYLDDILIYAKTEKEFIQRLILVLVRIGKHNIVMNPKKVFLGMKEIEFVGHMISENTISFSKDKIDKVLQIKPPVFGKDLKSFLGVVVYFKDHIPDFSMKVRVLHKMIHNYDKTRNKKLDWDDESKLAFENIKNEVNTLQALYFLDDISPIFLRTDASLYGIGGYLCQIINGIERPIGFMSKKLSDTEQRWNTTEKECYAIVKALDKFYYIIRDRTFTIQTDHKNLTYLDTKNNPKVRR